MEHNELKSKYDFDPERCDQAIETLAVILRGIPVTDQETRKRFQYALDDLIIDIAALTNKETTT